MNVAAPYVVPWNSVLIGLGAAVLICLAASVAPAFMVARREPLQLLQEGRSVD